MERGSPGTTQATQDSAWNCPVRLDAGGQLGSCRTTASRTGTVQFLPSSNFCSRGGDNQRNQLLQCGIAPERRGHFLCASQVSPQLPEQGLAQKRLSIQRC